MAYSRLLCVAAFVLTFQQASVQAVPASVCRQIVQYAFEHQSNDICKTVGVIKDLGCLCGENGEAVKQLNILDRMTGFEACFQPALTEETKCIFPSLADLAKKFSIPFTPGVISVPGLGFVQLQALSDEPSQVQIPHMGHMMLEQEPSDDSLISNEEIEDSRPVLDLGSLPLDTPFEIALDEVSNMAEITMSEDKLVSGDLAFNIDIGIPRSFLDNGGELDLDINDITDDLDILVDSDFELDVTFSSGVKQPIAGTTGKEFGSLHLESANNGLREFTQGSLDMNILPINIGAQNGDQDDVTIEMDIEVDGSSHIHDAVITLRDEDSVYPITGLEVGNLLTEISGWMRNQIPNYPRASLQDTQGVQGALRGVSKMLADVGEQVGEIMPNQELYNGQSLEIIAQDTGNSEKSEGAFSKSPCMLKALADAAASVMSRKVETQAKEEKKCGVCAFVNKHLVTLWCLVVLGTLYVMFTLLLSFYRFLRPSQTQSSFQEDDLEKPLILYASDFTQEGNQKEGFEPYCGPISHKIQVSQ